MNLNDIQILTFHYSFVCFSGLEITVSCTQQQTSVMLKTFRDKQCICMYIRVLSANRE